MKKRAKLDRTVSSIYHSIHGSSKPKGKSKTKKQLEKGGKNYPGSKTKPDHLASEKYAFKGGDPKLLKELREARDLELATPKEPTLQERLQDIRARKEVQRTERKNSVIVDGFIYLVTNPAHPGWVKIGQTSDFEKRLSAYQTASPHADYCMIAVRYVSDRTLAEAKFLNIAKLVYEVKGEWIKASATALIANFGV